METIIILFYGQIIEILIKIIETFNSLDTEPYFGQKPFETGFFLAFLKKS